MAKAFVGRASLLVTCCERAFDLVVCFSGRSFVATLSRLFRGFNVNPFRRVHPAVIRRAKPRQYFTRGVRRSCEGADAFIAYLGTLCAHIPLELDTSGAYTPAQAIVLPDAETGPQNLRLSLAKAALNSIRRRASSFISRPSSVHRFRPRELCSSKARRRDASNTLISLNLLIIAAGHLIRRIHLPTTSARRCHRSYRGKRLDAVHSTSRPKTTLVLSLLLSNNCRKHTIKRKQHRHHGTDPEDAFAIAHAQVTQFL